MTAIDAVGDQYKYLYVIGRWLLFSVAIGQRWERRRDRCLQLTIEINALLPEWRRRCRFSSRLSLPLFLFLTHNWRATTGRNNTHRHNHARQPPNFLPSHNSRKKKKNILFSSSSYLLVAFELLPVLLSWQRSKNAFTRLSHGLPSSKTPDAAATKSWLPSNHLSRKERGRKKRKKKKELELQSKWIHIFSGRYLSSWWQTCLVITGVYRFNLFSLYYTSLGEVLYWTQSFYLLEKKTSICIEIFYSFEKICPRPIRESKKKTLMTIIHGRRETVWESFDVIALRSKIYKKKEREREKKKEHAHV